MSTENLSQKEAIAKLKELSESARMCMFCTNLETLPIAARPMSLRETDEEGNLWFLSSAESNKNFEILEDNRVQLLFMNNGSSEYLSVYGKAYIYQDKNTIEEKWFAKAMAGIDFITINEDQLEDILNNKEIRVKKNKDVDLSYLI